MSDQIKSPDKFSKVNTYIIVSNLCIILIVLTGIAGFVSGEEECFFFAFFFILLGFHFVNAGKIELLKEQISHLEQKDNLND